MFSTATKSLGLLVGVTSLATCLLAGEGRTEFLPGDTVFIAQDGAELSLPGPKSAVLRKGAKATVTEVTEGWVGGAVELNGETALGWKNPQS